MVVSQRWPLWLTRSKLTSTIFALHRVHGRHSAVDVLRLPAVSVPDHRLGDPRGMHQPLGHCRHSPGMIHTLWHLSAFIRRPASHQHFAFTFRYLSAGRSWIAGLRSCLQWRYTVCHKCLRGDHTSGEWCPMNACTPSVSTAARDRFLLPEEVFFADVARGQAVGGHHAKPHLLALLCVAARYVYTPRGSW